MKGVERMEIYQVDAFTNQPYKGNPAAVCILNESKEDKWMYNVAEEMSLPETAFIHKKEGKYNLRWFTPTHEVDLCGHATLASAKVLWETENAKREENIDFHTKSGVLTAKSKGDWIELDFPIEAEKEVDPPEKLIKALDVKPKYVGKNRMDYLIEVDNKEIIQKIKPDFRMLKEVDARGIIVTSKANSNRYDFVSRFFAPAIGIDEDPVTGSAHCCLAPYWKKRLNKNQFTAYQASNRGGTIKIKLGKERVYLSGQAVIIMEGNLLK